MSEANRKDQAKEEKYHDSKIVHNNEEIRGNDGYTTVNYDTFEKNTNDNIDDAGVFMDPFLRKIIMVMTHLIIILLRTMKM